MNKTLKIILLGIFIWAIPFLASIAIWDVEAGVPLVSTAWFTTLMGLSGTIALVIALVIYFKKKYKDPIKEAWTLGLSWYVIMLVLDLIFLVAAFGTSITDYLRMIVTYLSTLIITVTVGYLKA